MNQVTSMMQKISRMRTEIDNFKERETQYLSKVAQLEKENKNLNGILDEKERKIAEITKRAKEDKVKMYQFLTELEAYKEATAELQKNGKENKDDSVGRLSETNDSVKKVEKPLMVNKNVQCVEEGKRCEKCERNEVLCS